MKNLIMADLKVLGNRLWSVPLMAFVLVSVVSLIPYVDMPDHVRNFMIALLSPCLLIFELLREEQKHSSDSMIMTMPVSKNIYVFSKYLTVVILSLTAIPAAWMSNFVFSAINGSTLSVAQSFFFLPGMLKIMMVIVPAVYFILPIYYFTKKLKSSIIAGIIIIGLINFQLLRMIYEYFYITFFEYNLHEFFLSALIVLVTAVVGHLIIKLYFRSDQSEWIRTGWFAVILILSVITFEILMRNLQFTYLYLHVIKNVDNVTGEQKERFIKIIRDYRLYISLLSVSMIILGSILYVMRKKSTQLFNQNSILYIFSPTIIIIVIQQLKHSADTLCEKTFLLKSEYYPYTENAMLLLTIIVSVIISIRASIYLLKNNRTLK
ncbi:MAG: ABC-2 transporter permease [Candidatus Delongbacteria bacterium]|nr:ABC-2 transporter permease [Candidatus Delongbacteria bacterium]